jgi:glycosyltransferase involved in cell wall biosynthesis
MDSHGFRLLYFAVEGIYSPVLDSQVLVPLRLLGEAAPHLDRRLLVLTSRRHRRNPRTPAREAEIREGLPGVKVDLRYRAMMVLPFQQAGWRRHLEAVLGTDADRRTPLVVHCRGQRCGAVAASLKRRHPWLRVLVDARGDPLDEFKRSLLSRWRVREARRDLQTALRAADGLNTVTSRLAEVLQAYTGSPLEMPRMVVGCCVDPGRFHFDAAIRAERRAHLGLTDKFVFCYCGSMALYQRFDVVARLFAGVCRILPKAHLLVITRDQGGARNHLDEAGVDPAVVTMHSARHDEVASYLMAGDVGLLIREDNSTNRVASPVKFAEYLRSGLPVLITSCVGDFGAFVADHGVGEAIAWPVREEEAMQACRRLRERLLSEGNEFRRYCSDKARQYWAWEGQLPRLMEMYERLAATV